MWRIPCTVTLVAACLCGVATRSQARGFGGYRGGGGGGGGGGAARGMAGGGMARPAMPNRPAQMPNRPAMPSRPSMPNLGGGGYPGGNFGGNQSGNYRPNPGAVSRPSISRPSASQPSVSRPATRPNPGGNIYGGSNSGGGFYGGMKPGNRPSTLPGTTRPANPRPGYQPGIQRPGGDLAGSGGMPSLGQRPGGRPTTRPTPGQVGDFLGMDRPRPGADRPTTLPDRLPSGSRPGDGRFDYGRFNAGNNVVINNRPSWVNIDRNRVNNIGNRWQQQIGGIQNWNNRHPDRLDHWNQWGNNVRHNWHYDHYHNCFNDRWWNNHSHHWCGWHYGYAFNRYPWGYWWTAPTYAACVDWFSWAPTAAWSQPVYYDYGTGGNVVYQDNDVYINDQLVASQEDFAQSAAVLATVPPPDDAEQAEESDWMPLGTFAVASDERDVNPSRMLQLAVNKDGVVSGTLFNTATDQAQSVQGQVDRQTQRVAFRVGDKDKIVVETGLYNLTQDQAPILVHYAGNKTENWLLVRLEPPAEDSL